jgi:predicted dehydrogenase
MNQGSPAVVIGYGSIGKRHARALASLGTSLAIVNRGEAVRAKAAEDHPSARIAARLEDLDAAGFRWRSAVAVIATWAPSHADFFHALADRGVRSILCEKLMASSVASAQGMVARAERDGIALGVNHTFRYAGLAPSLRSLAAESDLGEPASLVVEAGAACLVTNGVHWIDFATELFGALPMRVAGTAQGQPINPRSRDLMLYGGTAIWSFEGQREAVLSFSNHSSILPRARIVFRDGAIAVTHAIGETDQHWHARVSRRPTPAPANRVSRTAPASETVFDGQPFGTRGFNEGLQVAAEELLSGDMRTCPGRRGMDSVSTTLGALIAGRNGHAVDLPIHPESTFGLESWPVS